MRYLYVAVGFVSLGLGIVGAAVPVLPTTPFLLITLFCFAKGSERFYSWFVATRIYKKYLAGFVASRAMTRRAKINILALASSMLAFAFVVCDNPHARIAIVVLAACKYYYFFFRVGTIAQSDSEGGPAAERRRPDAEAPQSTRSTCVHD